MSMILTNYTLSIVQLLTSISGCRLECNTGRTVGWQLKEEGECIGSQLLDQSLLESRQGPLVNLRVLQWGEYLRRGEVQILPEGQAKNIKILPAISEGCEDMSVDLPVLEVLRVHQDNPVYWVNMSHMINKVSLAQIHRDLPIGGALLKHPCSLLLTC